MINGAVNGIKDCVTGFTRIAGALTGSRTSQNTGCPVTLSTIIMDGIVYAVYHHAGSCSLGTIMAGRTGSCQGNLGGMGNSGMFSGKDTMAAITGVIAGLARSRTRQGTRCAMTGGTRIVNHIIYWIHTVS